MRALIFWLCVILLLLTVANLVGCYSASKAKAQFGKAVVSYPAIGANFCAITYPPKDSLVKGDSIITYDTLWAAGDVHFDTVYSFRKDTVFITKITPGKTVFQTIWVTDTIRMTNTAALAACGLERGQAIELATEKTKEADKWKRIAKKRFWVILGMGAAMALGIFAMVRRRVVKKII